MPSTSRNASVMTGPGDTALTRMPRGPSSSASVSVMLSIPALAAAYGPVRGEPRVPAPDAMLTMTPPGPMRAAAAFAPWNAVVRLSSSCERKTSSGVSLSSRTVFSSEPPTLFTQTSRRPSSATVRSASCSE